ncbi:MAG: hypothetical protein QOH89_372, partial [Pseudonocardiales bacterium]|nr:hypothetical protein [Pseudonocardiales bacterium]
MTTGVTTHVRLAGRDDRARGVDVRCEGVVHIYPASGNDMDDVVALRGGDRVVVAGELVA